MGCDIHLHVEVKHLLEPNRADGRVRELERLRATGGPEAAKEYERIACPYWWEHKGICKENPDDYLSPLPLDPDIRVYDDYRNYELFSVIADVRQRHPDPIAPYRGIPDDISPQTRGSYSYWHGDAHGTTHGFVGEFAARAPELIDLDGYPRSTFWDMVLDLTKKYGPEGARLVFWFDC